MSTKINSNCAKCRRAGEKLMLKGEKCMGPSCPFAKRSYPPGMHGPKQRRPKISNYGKQLLEKQKVKRMYGMMEKQFSTYIDKASEKIGDTSKHFIILLESRLDNTVFRAGFCKSRFTARQMVTHGLMTVNGKKVDVPSFQVKVGDIISIKEASVKKPIFEGLGERLTNSEFPSWISVDVKNLSAKVLNIPTLENPNYNAKSIIEFYSR